MRHLRRADFPFPPLYLEVDGEIEEFPDFPAIAKGYAEAVIEGREPACRYVKLACKRYLRMLRRAAEPNAPFIFSPAHAVDFLDFWEKCPVGTNWRGENYVEKEPFQIFAGCAIYGFRRKDRWQSRLVSRVYVEIPRKHAKSEMAAVIGLYDGIYAAFKDPVILIAAASEAQAEHVFGAATRILRDEPDLMVSNEIEITKKVIRFGKNRGIVQKLASVPKNQDGWNPSTIILDELHSQNAGVYEVMNSALGAKIDQLMLMITTAGRHAAGFGWNERRSAINVLEGATSVDHFFVLIFTVDSADLEDEAALLTDERIWIKANPMWGVSVDPSKIHEFAQRALVSPGDREEFLRTRLNVWSNSAERLVDPQAWAECGNNPVSISEMFGRKCWIGLDMSEHLDMTAIGLVFEEYQGRIPIFCSFYLPEGSPTLQHPSMSSSMMEWVDAGWLKIQYGYGVIDIDAIGDEILELYNHFDVQGFAYDRNAGGSIVGRRVYAEGHTEVYDYRNNAAMMTAPTENLLGMINSRMVAHDNNECLRWHALNVIGQFRRDGTVLPHKDAANSINKIDGFVALVMANGLRIGNEGITRKKPKQVIDPYRQRGLLGAETLSDGNL